jgi:hypothetical protein
MCLAVYIATNEEVKLESLVADKTEIYFQSLSSKEERALRTKFSKQNIYYVGSSSGCSCNIAFDSADVELLGDEENTSPQQLLDFLTEMTLSENIELYCCWEGEWNVPIESRKELDIRNISLYTNYLGHVLRK